MKLFRKKSQPEIAGRRRPQLGGNEQPDRPSQAFSYYSQRSAGTVSGTHPREATDLTLANRGGRHAAAEASQRSRRLLAGAAGILVIAAGLYLLMLSPEPRIILLQDKTTAYFLQNPGVYQQAAQQTLDASIFNRNKVTVDTGAVRLGLLKNYPELQNVSVALPIVGHQPQVYLEPYKPSFILTTANSNAFLLDATGRALATTTTVPNIEKLGVPTLQDRTGVDVKLGKRAVPSTTISFAQTVTAALEKAGVTPSSLVLPAAAYELDVYIAEKPYFVKFNLQNDPLQQAGTYLATRKRLEAERVTPGQYIDVRVAERAYYK